MANSGHYYEQDGVTIHHGDCLDVMARLEPESVDTILTDPPYLLRFMGTRWDQVSLSVPPDFGNWFAGLVDGEGCFRIHKMHTNQYHCMFQIKMRRDDKPMLEWIKRTLGFGHVRDVKGDGPSKPQAAYLVQSQKGCLALAKIFREFPLRSKKQKDLRIWIEALGERIRAPRGNRWTGPGDRGRLPELFEQLKRVRSYDENPRPFHPDEFWHYLWAREAFRVVKPGGHLLAFGGTRTFHRLTCAIEDAGWQIRDCVMWLYGSGFPKSHDISKAIDKAAGAERKVVGEGQRHGGGKDIRSGKFHAGSEATPDRYGKGQITTPATNAAKQWEGWGTALKPAWEPIIVAMKPLEGTFAQNAEKHGVAGLNIDGCRIESTDNQLAEKYKSIRNAPPRNNAIYGKDSRPRKEGRLEPHSKGRWPANVIHDGSKEVVDSFPDTGISRGGSRGAGGQHGRYSPIGAQPDVKPGFGDTGSAARFFYCAKASSADRGNTTYSALPLFNEPESEDSNEHPTVKPIELMQYLCRLTTTPTGGVMLDPFMGSGSTLVAAVREGRRCIGIELEEKWCKVAVQRLEQEKC